MQIKQSFLLLAYRGSGNKNKFRIPLLIQHVMPAVSNQKSGVIFEDNFILKNTFLRFVERVIIIFVIYGDICFLAKSITI